MPPQWPSAVSSPEKKDVKDQKEVDNKKASNGTAVAAAPAAANLTLIADPVSSLLPPHHGLPLPNTHPEHQRRRQQRSERRSGISSLLVSIHALSTADHHVRPRQLPRRQSMSSSPDRRLLL